VHELLHSPPRFSTDSLHEVVKVFVHLSLDNSDTVT